jgi:tRNA 2-selenouridine synthase
VTNTDNGPDFSASFPEKLTPGEFLKLASETPVVDVRSPSEFNYGHIPGAVNIPLFNDYERDLVGKEYKKYGRQRAILKGLELAGPAFSEKLKAAVTLASGGKLLVHCWRGGMRSETMSWMFSLAGISCSILEGGYKSYRSNVLEGLSQQRKYIILGGLTGSGKTEILKQLSLMGEQVVDLEAIACHRGSAFGSLGQEQQPSSEHFANLLFEKIMELDNHRRIWLEDESKNIGTVFLPDQFFNNMREAPVVSIMMDIETRLPRLLREYSVFPSEDLASAVRRISKRLGGDMEKEALESISSGNFARAIEITLRYYDKAYLYGLSKRKETSIKKIETLSDDAYGNALAVLEAAINF